jgi:hypothetical protein
MRVRQDRLAELLPGNYLRTAELENRGGYVRITIGRELESGWSRVRTVGNDGFWH